MSQVSCRLKKRVGEFESLFRRARNLVEKRSGSEVKTADFINDLAFTKILTKRYGEAIALGNDSLGILLRVENPPPENLILAFKIHAAAYAKLREFSEAEKWLRQALLVAENAYGTTHPAFGRTLILYSSILGNLNQKSEAKRLRKRGEEILAQSKRTNGTDYIVDLSDLRIVERSRPEGIHFQYSRHPLM